METSTIINIFAGIFSVAILTALCWFLSQEVAFYIIIPIILLATTISMIAIIKITGA
jgi:hypothetical protein